MLKVGIYIFGIDFLAETGASEWLMWLAAYSIIAASIVAMTKDNLKARLAYSTISQLSYITLGMALATSMGALGGGMHIAMHAMGKITLFMCAGSIYVATHKTHISQMNGLGRLMPITYGAFLIGALSIIGLPPLGGSWSKWLLIVGAADAGQQVMIAVLMLSSLLNVAYLLSIVGKGFFWPSKTNEPVKIAESPVLVWLPPALTAFGCLGLFFLCPVPSGFPVTNCRRRTMSDFMTDKPNDNESELSYGKRLQKQGQRELYIRKALREHFALDINEAIAVCHKLPTARLLELKELRCQIS